jgi:hypothetical protein
MAKRKPREKKIKINIGVIVHPRDDQLASRIMTELGRAAAAMLPPKERAELLEQLDLWKRKVGLR